MTTFKDLEDTVDQFFNLDIFKNIEKKELSKKKRNKQLRQEQKNVPNRM